ncbi:hypothetical protein OPQ81_003722 [Rhizoctonia solani]|nr:hypothetical protein OPQ81_003722 [Rhizoctonia solani]
MVAGALCTYILALVQDIASQKRAKRATDNLYDQDALPKWYDEQWMPFVKAVIKEVLHWRPPIPAGVPADWNRRIIMGVTTFPKIHLNVLDHLQYLGNSH